MSYVRNFISDYCIIDLETTGLTASSCQIIEIGALKIRNGQIVEQYNQLIKPTCYIPDIVTQLTGITNQDVQNQPTIEEGIPDFLQFIQNDLLIGHNIRFDLSFLKQHVQLLNDYSDTLHLAQKYLPGQPSYKLSALQKSLHLSKNTHRSLDDCQTTYELYEYIKSQQRK